MNPEQALEWKLRRVPAVEFKLEKETHPDTEDSIKAAEKITGGKMADPADFKEPKPKEITPWVPPPEDDEKPKEEKKKMLFQYPGVTMISSAAQL